MRILPLSRRVHSALIDLGVLAGLALIARGLFQWSVPAGWIFVGLVVVVVCLILALPRATDGPLTPSGDQ